MNQILIIIPFFELNVKLPNRSRPDRKKIVGLSKIIMAQRLDKFGRLCDNNYSIFVVLVTDGYMQSTAGEQERYGYF